jgi:hypothetical protein
MPCQNVISTGAVALANAPTSHGGNFSTGIAVVVGPGATLDDDVVDAAPDALVEDAALTVVFVVDDFEPPHADARSATAATANAPTR